MKKLILALSAALLMLTACEEKTQTYTYKNLQYTIPASWEVDTTDCGEDGVMVYFQDPKVLSNSVYLDITPMSDDFKAELAESTPEQRKGFLADQVEQMYDKFILQDDDYTLDDFFGYEVKATDTQAIIAFSGNAYEQPYCGTIEAYMQDGFIFAVFVSGKDDKSRAKVAQYMNYEVL